MEKCNNMSGFETRYLYYNTGKSEVTVPRKILIGSGFDWQHGDEIFLIVKEIDNIKGIFLYKEGKGITRYIHYEKTNKSMITIPRGIIEANNLNWNHRNIILLVVKTIENQKGIFLFKKGDQAKKG